MTLRKFAACALILTFVFGAGLFAGTSTSPVSAEAAQNPRIYELRTYTTAEGKLDALHERFSNHTNTLFVRHGMTLIGYWTPSEGEEAGNTLVYLIAHESRDAARENWAAFGQDEEWRKAYADSRKDGPLVTNIVSKFLVPTNYSPLR